MYRDRIYQQLMEVVQGILEVGKVVVVKSRRFYVCVYMSYKVIVKKLKKLKPRNIRQGILHRAIGNLPSYIVCDSEIYLNGVWFVLFFYFFYILQNVNSWQIILSDS